MPIAPNLLLLETRLTVYNTAASRDVAHELRRRVAYNKCSEAKLELIDELLTFWETHHASTKKPA